MGEPQPSRRAAPADATAPTVLGGPPPPEHTLSADDRPDVVAAGPSEPGELAEAGPDGARPEVRYLIEREVARGGFGRILATWDCRLGRRIAIKEPLDAASASRLEREARITARLQHPAIVPVHDAGRRADGRPFYTMKLVSGRSLRDEIAERSTLVARMALLPRAIGVCEAIAYAHSEKVIHRDLKPSNVLCGSFGETVVVDWGLAKRIDDEESVSAQLPPAAGDATADGAVLGTPAYMPPEQARGDKVDERADVYSLGAILYHLVTGAAPYAASAGTLGEVLAGPPPPLAERAHGVAAELAAIVTKAMARDPAARYPTAGELVDDLRRFQTGKLVSAHEYSLAGLLARRVRRHAAVVAVVAVAALVLAGVGLESLRRVVRARDEATAARTSADAARQTAVLQRGAAEALVEYMLSDLRPRLARLGRLEMLDGVGARVDAYYQSLGDHDEDQASATRRGRALAVLSQLLQDRGNVDAALSSERASLAVRRRLAAAAPDDPEPLRQLIESHTHVSGLELARHHIDVAFAEAQAAVVLGTELTARGGDRLARRLLGIALAQRADVHEEAGRLDDAWADNLAALALREVLAREQPPAIYDGKLLLQSISQCGDLAMRRGELADGEERLQRAVVLAHELIARDPGDLAFRKALAVTHLQRGSVIASQGRLDDAIVDYRAAQQAIAALVDRDPDNTEWLRILRIAHSMVGQVELTRGDVGAARVALDAALDAARRLASLDPDNQTWQLELTDTLAVAGIAAYDAHQLDEAKRDFEEGVAVAERMSLKTPDDPHVLEALRQPHMRLGEIALVAGDLAAAERHLTTAVEVAMRRVDKMPGVADAQEALAEVHYARAGLASRRGDHAASLADLRASAAIYDALAASQPANRFWESASANLHGELGLELLDSGDRAAARAELATAAPRLRRMRDQRTLRAELVPRLAAYEAARRRLDRGR